MADNEILQSTAVDAANEYDLSALAFTADFPPTAPKFHQRTHRVR